jgi:hypothetical protein
MTLLTIKNRLSITVIDSIRPDVWWFELLCCIHVPWVVTLWSSETAQHFKEHHFHLQSLSKPKQVESWVRTSYPTSCNRYKLMTFVIICIHNIHALSQPQAKWGKTVLLLKLTLLPPGCFPVPDSSYNFCIKLATLPQAICQFPATSHNTVYTINTECKTRLEYSFKECPEL